MKKMFRCPVCGEKTISIDDKFKTSYRLRTTIMCKNCGNELIESSLAMLGIMVHGMIVALLYFLNLNTYIKIIIFVIIFLPIRYICNYVVPLIKYKK